jgi:hypothetical protein
MILIFVLLDNNSAMIPERRRNEVPRTAAWPESLKKECCGGRRRDTGPGGSERAGYQFIATENR